MKMRRIALLIAVSAAPLTLAGCGEGWVPQQIREFVPYTEERTAGPGIEYVRAHMLQERGAVLEPQMVAPAPAPEPEPTVEEVLDLPPQPAEPIKSSEELFKDKIKK